MRYRMRTRWNKMRRFIAIAARAGWPAGDSFLVATGCVNSKCYVWERRQQAPDYQGTTKDMDSMQQVPDYQGTKKDMDSTRSCKLVTIFSSLIFGAWCMGILPEAAKGGREKNHKHTHSHSTCHICSFNITLSLDLRVNQIFWVY